MRPGVICIKRQPTPCPLGVAPGESMIIAASEGWIGRDITQEAIGEVDVVAATGQKSIEGGVGWRAGVPGCRDIGSAEKRGDGIHSSIKSANGVAAELHGQLQAARSEVAHLEQTVAVEFTLNPERPGKDL